MKKLLIFLFLLFPLFTQAQDWFTADAVCIDTNNGSSGWQDCRARIFTDNSGNVKIFTVNDTLVYRRVGDHTAHTDANGDQSMSWPCADDEGIRCTVSFDIVEGVSFMTLEYPDYIVIYHINYDA